MKKEKICLRCGGSAFEPGSIQSTGKIYFHANNTKFMTFQTSDIPVHANLCMDCGTLDLIADVKKAHSLTDKSKSES